MKMPITITYVDGRVVHATTRPKDCVAFERQYGESIEAIKNAPKIEYIHYLAWSALHTTARESRSFDEFLDVVDEITVGGEAPVDPSLSAASDGPSPD